MTPAFISSFPYHRVVRILSVPGIVIAKKEAEVTINFSLSDYWLMLWGVRLPVGLILSVGAHPTRAYQGEITHVGISLSQSGSIVEVRRAYDATFVRRHLERHAPRRW